MNRRDFVAGGLLLPLTGMAGAVAGKQGAGGPMNRVGGPNIRISLNAYSFNAALRAGEMTLNQLLEYCAQLNFDGVDLTGYYFQGYPADPSLREITEVKRRAFLLGLEISGTGVRNDFTRPAGPELDGDVQLVKNWLGVAARLGAPNLRVFAGRKVEEDSEWSAARDRVVRALTDCTSAAAGQGVMLAIQNHAEFIRDSAQLLSILDRVNSPWLGVNLDIGSFPTADPYSDVAASAPYAVAWQIKQEVSRGDRKEPVDLKQVAAILRESQYRGYILLETLGEGDPRLKVPRFLDEIRNALDC